MVLDIDEVGLLYRAAFLARLCNIAFNGLGGCRDEIRPEKEPHRRKLEMDFMRARTALFASSGWQHLTAARKATVARVFLQVKVMDENLA
jgi:hypothetical protein